MHQKCKKALARYIDIFNHGNQRDGQKIIVKPAVARIIQLPHELLLRIRAFLSLTSQACLALTCKTFFSFTGEVLSSSEFDLPSMTFDNNDIIGTWGLGHSLRWELLCRLEDARWLICSQCIKLRPVNRFSAPHFRGRGSRRCDYGPDEGIIEICACIRMSFGERVKLIAQLETLREDSLSEGSPFWHECLTVRGGRTVLTQAQPALREDGSLVFQMRYCVTIDDTCEFIFRPLQDMPVFCCPHQPASHIIMDARWGYQRINDSCYRCETFLTNFTRVENSNEAHYTLQTTRNLGKSRELADKTWYNQCNHHLRRFGVHEEDRITRESGNQVGS